MFDKATRQYFTLIFAIYLTALLGLSVVTATMKTPLGNQVAEAPQDSASRTTNSTPKRDTIVPKKIAPLGYKTDPEYVRSQARIWFHTHIDGYHEEWVCIDEIIHRESRWIPNLHNSQGSTAYGLGQVKDSHHYTKNKPILQFKVAIRYAIHKYGTMCAALQHHDEHGWY